MNKLNQVLADLNQFDYPTISVGKASNVKDFFEEIIKPQFVNVDIIKQQHRAILDYINMETPTFFIRAHGSQKRENSELLRRGYLSKYNNNVKYAFCDNTFAGFFASLKIAGIKITADLLQTYFHERNVICGFAQTSHEKEFAAFKPENAFYSKLNQKGWYLAHIFSVGECYSDFRFSNERDKYFPRGNREEWSNLEKIRSIERIPSDIEVKLLKAHFIRFTHPLNSFLVPKRSIISYNRGTQIGEEPELIDYVSQFLKKNFSNEYAELANLIYKIDLPSTFADPISEIKWGLEIKQKSIKKTKSSLSGKTVSIIRQEVIPEIKKIKKNVNTSTLELLNRMGSEAFIYYYLPLKSNFDINTEKLASFAPKSIGWSENSKNSRASVARRIFRENREKEALSLIMDQNLNSNLIQMAQRYYDELINEIEE